MFELDGEREWYNLVEKTITDNPKFAEVTMAAMTAGIQNRLDEEITKRADAETALSMCFDLACNKLKKSFPLNYETCKKVLINSHMFGGTEYVKKL